MSGRSLFPFLLLAWLGAGLAQAASPDTVTVLFPRVPEPYRTLLLQIVDGNRQVLGDRAVVQEVESNETAAAIAARIAGPAAPESLDGCDPGTARRLCTRKVLLLGPWGFRVAADLDPDIIRVVGGVQKQPAEFPPGVRGISMLPAPRSVFARLKEVAPSVRRIWVIHSSDESWIIERAAREAKELGLDFDATRRDTLTDGAKAYIDLIGRLHSTEDALWLPPRSRFGREESVLDAVIATAWKNNFIVFSSDADLTQRGVMLGVLPNYFEMGRALGELAGPRATQGEEVQLLESLDLTINLKTANHLGLKIDANDARFKVVWGR